MLAGQTQTPGEEKEIADGSEQRGGKRAEEETAIRVSSSLQQDRIIRQLNKNVKMILCLLVYHVGIYYKCINALII